MRVQHEPAIVTHTACACSVKQTVTELTKCFNTSDNTDCHKTSICKKHMKTHNLQLKGHF